MPESKKGVSRLKYPPPPPTYMKLAEAAEYLGMALNTVRRLCLQHHIIQGDRFQRNSHYAPALYLLRESVEKYKKQRETIINYPHTEHMSKQRRDTLHLLFSELAYRQLLALSIYEPLPQQLAFHQSQSKERIIIGGNRGTKTLCCAAELAMAVTGNHPWRNYPKENGRAICVAKDGIKIGEVFYEKLFKSGAIRMMQENKRYRAWHPKQDDGTYPEWKDSWIGHKPALPLIPKRMIKSIAWEDKKLNQPKVVELTNGWRILFFTSAGRPMEGIDIDIAWFDEEIYGGTAGGDWYHETAARLIDRNGTFMWSATPQAATPELWKLHERAEDERNSENPGVAEFHVTMDDNPFLPQTAKDLFKHKASFDPDEYRVRVLGEFLLTSHFVYPNFSKALHCCQPFEIPADWTRYMVLDPGFANIVATFFAVPPKNGPPHVYLYDEHYAHQVDAQSFVRNMVHKFKGVTFQSFLIDKHGAKRTEVNGLDIGESFAKALRVCGVRSLQTGSDFHRVGGVSDSGVQSRKTGISMVREWLWMRDEFHGTPKLQVFRSCENFIYEISKYRNKIDKGKPTDEPDQKSHSHGPDTLRYAAIHGLPYMEQKRGTQSRSSIVQYWLKKQRAAKKGKHFIHLGPGE